MPAGSPRLTREHLERAWDARPAELGAVALLAPRVLLPVMNFAPAGIGAERWYRLCDRWQRLPPHPHILALVGVDGGIARMQFALLDFRSPHRDAATRQQQVRQLIAAFEHIATHVAREDWWLFSRPRIYVDLDDAVRLAFLPPVAAEGPTDLERVIAFSWHLFDAEAPVTGAGAASAVREGDDLEAWRAVETGVGLVMADRPDAALPHLRHAEELWPSSSLVQTAIAACEGALVLVEALDHERDFVEALHWPERHPSFAELYPYDDGRLVPVVMFAPASENAHWDALRAAWRALPIHDVVLDALSVDADGRLVLRFAAIAWRARVVGRHALTFASELVAAYQHIARWVPSDRWWLFLDPQLYLDVAGHLRVAFEPPATKPLGAVTEATLVELVALLLRHRSDADSSPLRSWIEQCFDRAKRSASLQVLARELEGEGADLRSNRQWDAWRRAEEGLGLLLLERPADAREAFDWANYTRSSVLTRWGVSRCDKILGPRSPTQLPAQDPWVPHAWSAVESRIASLEAERDFVGALQLYDQVEPITVQVATARARCHLDARQIQQAIQWAQTALIRAPAELEARRTLTRALIEHRAVAEALRHADQLLHHVPHDATAHYLRGKALLGLRRLDEARESFDLALALRPTLGEALLLRREAARLLKALGKDVGQQQTTIAIPPSLEALRETLLGGRAKAILEALSAPSLIGDPAAQLMLARYLGFEGQHERALAIYERLTDGPYRAAALVGKAGALHGQGSHASALAILDATIGEFPQDVDACEVRARVLAAMGRAGEAAAEFRRFVQLGTARSDVRVRAAQLWLDAH